MKYTHHTIAALCFFCSLMLLPESASAKLDLKLRVLPEKPQIEIGSAIKELTLIARINAEGVSFRWELDGPGRLDGEKTSRKIRYVLPESLQADSEYIRLTVFATDENGETVKEETTFTLLAPASEAPIADEQEQSLLKQADEYFQRSYLLQPEGENAFELYQNVLQIEPDNAHASKMVRKIAETYREWGEDAEKHGQRDRAREYYERYQFVADYILKDLQDSSIQGQARKIQQKLSEFQGSPEHILSIKLTAEHDEKVLFVKSPPEELTLTANSDGWQLHFDWHLDGPGKLKGDTTNSTIVYVAPESLEEHEQQATITVKVRDEFQQEVTDSMTFLLKAPQTLDILQFEIGYWYHPAGEKEFRPLQEGSILNSGDYYRITFTPQQDAYVYIYQIDGSGQVFQLFPMERFGGKVVNNFNPVSAEVDYYAPGDDTSFVLDELTGTERIYFVASREQNHFLEERYEQLQNAHQDQQEALFQEIIRQVMQQHGVEYTKPEVFQGVQDELESLCQGCVYELSFEHW